MKKIILSVCIIFFLGLPIFGQSKLSPYTENLLPYLKKTCRLDSISDFALKLGVQSSGMQTYIPAYIHLSPDADISNLEEYGVKVNLKLKRIITAQVPVDVIREIAELEDVKYIETALPVQEMMDLARPASLVDKVQQGVGLSMPFRGKDVVVGVIDAGFQYTHANFYNIDKTEFRIKRAWEQNLSSGTPPQGFTYGGELTQEQMLEACADVRSSSHGTHVAGIVAGTDTLNENPYYGIAGEADILLVSMGNSSQNNVNLSDAISYIYNYAESVNKPCVINMSLGSQIGPHDGTSTFDQVSNELQGRGKLLVGSVGNFGADKFHLSKSFDSANDEPLRSFIDFKKNPSKLIPYGNVDIWGDEGMKYTLKLCVYDTYNKKEVDMIDVIDVASIEGNSIDYEFQKGVTGSIKITTEVNPLNNKPHAYLSFDVTSIRLNHSVGFTITPQNAGTVHVWADDVYVQLSNKGLEGWSDGNNEYSLAEIGGTGKNIISVGAYVTRNEYWTEKDTTRRPLKETLNTLATFSSKGPTTDGRIKPDITAPGTYIVSSISLYDETILSQRIVKTTEWNNTIHYYAFMQGTSMSSPYVAGVIATWLQANPRLNPDDIRNILKSTAIQDEYTGILPEKGNEKWGLGKIDAWNGIKKSLELATTMDAVPESVPEILLTAIGDKEFNLLFTKDCADVSVAVYALNGQVVYQKYLPRVKAAEEVTIRNTSLSNGIYLIRISNTQMNETFKIALN